MLSGISLTCFATSYAVTLALELTRLLFRSGIRGAVMVGFAAAGLFAHTVYLYHRATVTVGPPLASERDWYLLAAWGLAAVYLYLTIYHRKTAFGVFVLPLVLVLLAVAAFVADPRPFARAPASWVWGMIHGVSLLLAVLAVLVGFVAGLMYLSQARRLKHGRFPKQGLRLPSLEWLERINGRAIVISLTMLVVGVLSGIVLNALRQTDRVPWSDPVILSSTIMLGWLAIAGCAGLVYRPAVRGRRVAYLTMVSFVFLAIVLAAGLFLRTQHGGPRTQTPWRTTSALQEPGPGDQA
jgi:ABC-type transport system involved in cytochrome c biogenesis permease subunit